MSFIGIKKLTRVQTPKIIIKFSTVNFKTLSLLRSKKKNKKQ